MNALSRTVTPVASTVRPLGILAALPEELGDLLATMRAQGSIRHGAGTRVGVGDHAGDYTGNRADNHADKHASNDTDNCVDINPDAGTKANPDARTNTGAHASTGPQTKTSAGVETITHGRRDYHVGAVHGAPCVVTLARVGKVAAAATASALIHEFDVHAIVLVGVAGGVARAVRIGDVVVGDALVQHDMDASPLFPRFEIPLLDRARFPADPRLSAALAAACEAFVADEGAALAAHFGTARPRVHRGLVISGDQFVASAQAVDALRAGLPEALAVEMEGAAIAQVCYEYGVPCAVVRTISDTADEHAGASFASFLADLAGTYSSGILKRFLLDWARNGRGAADNNGQ